MKTSRCPEHIAETKTAEFLIPGRPRHLQGQARPGTQRSAFGRCALGLCLLIATMAPTAAFAQSLSSRELTRFRAAIPGTFSEPNPQGLIAIPITAEVLEASQPNLVDIQVYTDSGTHFPGILRQRLPATPQRWILTPEGERLSQTPVRGAPNRVTERYDFVVPERDQATPTALELVVEPNSPSYNREVVVHIAAAPENDEAVPPIEASLFRSPSGERLSIPLASIPPGTAVSFQAVGEGPYVQPQFFLQEVLPPEEPRELTVPLEELRRERQGNTLTLRLQRPRSVHVERLSLITESTGHNIEVVAFADAGRERQELARGRFVRVGDAGEDNDELALVANAADVIEVRLSGAELPDDLRIGARLEQPELVVIAAPRQFLYYGAVYPLAHAPNLDARHPHLQGNPTIRRENLGMQEANPDFRDEGLLDFALRAGATVDRALFAHRGTLTLGEHPHSLHRFQLSPEDLAKLRGDNSDLRIVDADGNQWAYVASDAVPRRLELRAEPSSAGAHESLREVLDRTDDFAGASVYPVAAPAGLIISQLHISVPGDNPFADRHIGVYGRHGSQWQRFAWGHLAINPEQREPLGIEIHGRNFDALALVVADGNDAPLNALRVEVDYAQTDFSVVAPPGNYDVLFGSLEPDRVSYELERHTDQIAAIAAAPVGVEDIGPNPEFDEPSAFGRDELQSIALWAVLIVGVGLLLLVTYRSLQGEGEGDGDGDGDDASEEPAAKEKNADGPHEGDGAESKGAEVANAEESPPDA